MTVFIRRESPPCIRQGSAPPVGVCGWYVASEKPWLIKLQLSLSCIPLSINICSILSEPIWDCQWEMQLWRCNSWEHRLPSTSSTADLFFLSPLKHSPAVEWVSEREGAQLTQMLHKLQFSLTCVYFVQVKKCTRMALRGTENPRRCSIIAARENCYFSFLLEVRGLICSRVSSPVCLNSFKCITVLFFIMED